MSAPNKASVGESLGSRSHWYSRWELFYLLIPSPEQPTSPLECPVPAVNELHGAHRCGHSVCLCSCLLERLGGESESRLGTNTAAVSRADFALRLAVWACGHKASSPADCALCLLWHRTQLVPGIQSISKAVV